MKSAVVGCEGSPDVIDARGNAVGFVDSNDTGTVVRDVGVGAAPLIPVGALAGAEDAAAAELGFAPVLDFEDCAQTTATRAKEMSVLFIVNTSKRTTTTRKRCGSKEKEKGKWGRLMLVSLYSYVHSDYVIVSQK